MGEKQLDINDAIKLTIKKILDAYCKDWHQYYVINDEDSIEAGRKKKEGDISGMKVIRLGINHGYGQVYISNIFVPKEDRGKKIGMCLLYMVYKMAEKFSYDVFLVDMVDSFREKMLSRGALLTDIYDTLQIVENTRLN